MTDYVKLLGIGKAFSTSIMRWDRGSFNGSPGSPWYQVQKLQQFFGGQNDKTLLSSGE